MCIVKCAGVNLIIRIQACVGWEEGTRRRRQSAAKVSTRERARLFQRPWDGFQSRSTDNSATHDVKVEQGAGRQAIVPCGRKELGPNVVLRSKMLSSGASGEVQTLGSDIQGCIAPPLIECKLTQRRQAAVCSHHCSVGCTNRSLARLHRRVLSLTQRQPDEQRLGPVTAGAQSSSSTAAASMRSWNDMSWHDA